MAGNLFIVSAPSGAGKTTLVHMLLEKDPGIHVSVSSTTRAPRTGEINGREYNFVSKEDFLKMQQQGDFLEWAEVHGNYYGTSKVWVEKELAQGHDVLLEIDWQGAQLVRKVFPQAIGIFILPPSMDTLEKRLSGRGTDSKETIERRIAAAKDEIRHSNEFEYVIINDDLQEALNGLSSVVNASRLSYASQRQRFSTLFEAFISF